MDAVLLARAQFAANMSFHILFPAISIALGWMLVFFRWRWLRTHGEAWLLAYRFWTKVFALSFALGVVSGITMSFQFGTNWPGYMEHVGDIAGLLRGTANASTALVLRVGLTVAAVLVPVQILVGDMHGLNTLEHQPQKVAAIEAIWHTERGAPLLLFAWPDEEARSNRYAIAVPR